MKGVCILTEARSGSNWLGSLANRTGRMGKSAEWLDPEVLKLPVADYEGLHAAIMTKAATENGRFAIKLFPRHLQWAEDRFGADFLFDLASRHDLGFVLLERKDRIRQAVSLARAKMSNKFTSIGKSDRPEAYDAGLILQSYFFIGKSYAFWKSYMELSGRDFRHVFYEDMLDSPAPYVDAVADILDVESTETFESRLEIQRDEVTEEWANRFTAEFGLSGLRAGNHEKPASRNLDNLARFLGSRPTRGSVSIY